MINLQEKWPEQTIETIFKKLYDQYSGRIYRFAMTLTKGDEYLSEEILQIAFTQLWEHRHNLTTEDNMLQYLYQTAKHTFFNYCRHEMIEKVYKDYILEQAVEVETETEEKQNAESLEAFVRGIVQEMPPVRRKVFLMSRYKQMSNKAIAEELGISIKTVEVHITLALKQLRDKLKNEEI